MYEIISFLILLFIVFRQYNVLVLKGKPHYVNMFIHEDFMVSYAFRKATNVPAIFQMNFNQYDFMKDGIGESPESPAIVFHGLKDANKIYEHEYFFYDVYGNLRSYPDLKKLLEERMAAPVTHY